MLSSVKQLEIKKQLEETLEQLFNTLATAFETESQQELEAAWAMTKQNCREHTSDLFLDGLLRTALKTKQFLAFERALFLMLCNIETLYPTSGKNLQPIIYALHRVLYFTRQEWQAFLASAECKKLKKQLQSTYPEIIQQFLDVNSTLDFIKNGTKFNNSEQRLLFISNVLRIKDEPLFKKLIRIFKATKQYADLVCDVLFYPQNLELIDAKDIEQLIENISEAEFKTITQKTKEPFLIPRPMLIHDEQQFNATHEKRSLMAISFLKKNCPLELIDIKELISNTITLRNTALMIEMLETFKKRKIVLFQSLLEMEKAELMKDPNLIAHLHSWSDTEWIKIIKETFDADFGFLEGHQELLMLVKTVLETNTTTSKLKEMLDTLIQCKNSKEFHSLLIQAESTTSSAPKANKNKKKLKSTTQPVASTSTSSEKTAVLTPETNLAPAANISGNEPLPIVIPSPINIVQQPKASDVSGNELLHEQIRKIVCDLDSHKKLNHTESYFIRFTLSRLVAQIEQCQKTDTSINPLIKEFILKLLPRLVALDTEGDIAAVISHIGTLAEQGRLIDLDPINLNRLGNMIAALANILNDAKPTERDLKNTELGLRQLLNIFPCNNTTSNNIDSFFRLAPIGDKYGKLPKSVAQLAFEALLFEESETSDRKLGFKS